MTFYVFYGLIENTGVFIPVADIARLEEIAVGITDSHAVIYIHLLSIPEKYYFQFVNSLDLYGSSLGGYGDPVYYFFKAINQFDRPVGFDVYLLLYSMQAVNKRAREL